MDFWKCKKGIKLVYNKKYNFGTGVLFKVKASKYADKEI